jgi:uncharacterized protein YqgC (DUF456 family)
MENFLNISVFALVQIFMLVGLFGLVVPIFPGLVVMWLAALGYGVASGFSTLGIVLFVIISILMVVGSLADNVLMGAGARKGGASWTTLAVALVAGVVGTFLVPPIGGLIAAPAAVLLLEYQRLGDWQKAMAALRGLATGWGLSFVVRFILGVIIQLLWWLWVWQG